MHSTAPPDFVALGPIVKRIDIAIVGHLLSMPAVRETHSCQLVISPLLLQPSGLNFVGSSAGENLYGDRG